MAPRKKTTLSKEEIAKKKSEQAKRRLEKIKNDLNELKFLCIQLWFTQRIK